MFFKKKAVAIVTLKMKLMPLDRGEIFEDPLDEELKQLKLGAVSGGGTSLTPDGEVDTCDLELELLDVSDESLFKVIDMLEKRGAAKGSVLSLKTKKLNFGKSEGLALYLNGTDLPAEVYETSDVNVIYQRLEELIDGHGMIFSHWQGPTSTALYMYGPSFEVLKVRIADYVSTEPLCQQSRIVQVA